MADELDEETSSELNSPLVNNDQSSSDEIIREDILTAVQNWLGTSNVEIINYTLIPAGERVGLLGDHSFLMVNILETKSKTERDVHFFIKYFPRSENMAKFAEGIGAFKKETFIYKLLEEFTKSDINNLISNCTAKCYLAKYNKYLFLEDLKSNGFEELNKKELLDYDTLLIVLQSLAKLHAASIIYEEKKSSELEKEYRLIEEYPEGFEESFFNNKDGFINLLGVEASIKGIINEIDIFEFPEKLPTGKSFKEVARNICYKIYDLVKPSKKYRNVLCHGDLWATNFLIKYTNQNRKHPVECKFVDFQCGRYVPPSQDVLSVLYLTTSREFRGKYMYQMIGMYYSYLEKHLKIHGYNLNTIIPFVDFMNSCEEQKLFAIVQTAIYFQLILIDNKDVEEYLENVELNQKAFFEDRSHLVLAHISKDDIYAKRLRESIEDLKEYCNYVDSNNRV